MTDLIKSALAMVAAMHEAPSMTAKQLVAYAGLKEALAEAEKVGPVAWIPVSQEMPKSGQKVLACYRNELGKSRRIRAEWIAAKTQEADVESELGEYDEATDTYYTPEGWYECIDNWDEYSSVLVHHAVTHWMPLPAEPEPDAAPDPDAKWVRLTREQHDLMQQGILSSGLHSGNLEKMLAILGTFPDAPTTKQEVK